MPTTEAPHVPDDASPDLATLAATIGYEFDDLRLLRQAMAHRSWCAETPDERSNERLEFLGDAVLGWVSSQPWPQRNWSSVEPSGDPLLGRLLPPGHRMRLSAVLHRHLGQKDRWSRHRQLPGTRLAAMAAECQSPPVPNIKGNADL